MATGDLVFERQILVASALIEVLILETDAGEIPAIRGNLSHALTSSQFCLALSTLVAEIGGLPNLIDSARAAA